MSGLALVPQIKTLGTEAWPLGIIRYTSLSGIAHICISRNYPMNKLKQIFGVVWMILAVMLVIFMVYQAYAKVNIAPEGVARTNTLLQWIIILIIFIPICGGLFIFGKYALKKEFDNLDD